MVHVHQAYTRCIMKKLFVSFVLILATNIIFCSTLLGHSRYNSTGLILRGSYWYNGGQTSVVTISSDRFNDHINVGHAGGWLSIMSRTSESSYVEFSIGALGRFEVKSKDYWDEEVEVDGIAPVLLGFRQNFFTSRYYNALQPYFSFGGGPYWQCHTHVEDSYNDSKVTVKSKLYPGIYAGAGFDFMVWDWFGFNFDCKYHYINFDSSHEHNGFDFGIGLVFQWGRYRRYR